MVFTKKKRTRAPKRRKSLVLSAQKSDVSYARRRSRKKILGVFSGGLTILKKIKQLRWHHVWYVLFGSMALFILFALASPYFHVKTITISGDTYAINPTEVEATFKDIYGTNMLFLTNAMLQQRLTDSYPEFESVSIIEHWPNKLEFNITISEPFMTIINQDNGSTAVITQQGIVLPIPPQEELPLLKIKQYEPRFQNRKKIIDRTSIEKIFIAEKIFTEDIQLAISDMIYFWGAQELHLITPDNTAVWIDLQEPVEEQLLKLQYGKDDIGLYENNFEHIDLRIPKQLIWKQAE
jgi:hypothetical protein